MYIDSKNNHYVRAQINVSNWPFLAALLHVSGSHSQPFSRAHLSISTFASRMCNSGIYPGISKWPFAAALEHTN